MISKFTGLFGLVVAFGLNFSAYAGDDVFGTRPGDDLLHLVSQTHAALPKTKEENPSEALTDAEEMSLLESSIGHVPINEEQFEIIVAIMTKRLEQLSQEAFDAQSEHEHPFRTIEPSAENPNPPRHRTISDIRKDARNVLRYMIVRASRANTSEIKKRDKKNLMIMGASALSVMATVAYYLHGPNPPPADMAITFVAASGTFGLFFPGLFVAVLHSMHVEFKERERLLKQFLAHLRTQGVDWNAAGIDLQAELQLLSLARKGKNEVRLEYREFCNNLLNDPTVFAPIERIRVEKPAPEVRVEEFEPEAAVEVEASPESSPKPRAAKAIDR